MNSNIKVINDNLWTVNFSYVGMDFIQELSFKKTTASDFMTLTQDGKLIFNNNDDEAMNMYLPTMKVVMSFPDRLLVTDRGFGSYIKVFVPTLDKLNDNELVEYLKKENLYTNNRAAFDTACKWERTRRKLHKKYVRKHWFSIGINKLLKRMGVKK